MTAPRDIQSDALGLVLRELEALHERETAVLRAMDHVALDELTVEKDRLSSRLRDVLADSPPEPCHKEALERLRHRATLNQLLIVHAREAVRTILSQVTGAPSSMDAHPGARRPVVQDGVRVNFRG